MTSEKTHSGISICVEVAHVVLRSIQSKEGKDDMFVRIVVTELGPVSEKFMSSNTSTNDRPHEDLLTIFTRELLCHGAAPWRTA